MTWKKGAGHGGEITFLRHTIAQTSRPWLVSVGHRLSTNPSLPSTARINANLANVGISDIST